MVSQSNGFFMIISAKTTSHLCNVNEKTAQKMHRDIKSHYGIPYVTFYHLADFLGLPIEYLERYSQLMLNSRDLSKMELIKQQIKLGPILVKSGKKR